MSRFKIGQRVKVAECYLNDEVNKDNPHTSPTAKVDSIPKDDEELVAIIYDGGAIDFVPQDILEPILSPWKRYDQDHLINMENGMIVVATADLDNIQHKDIVAFD